MTSLLIFIKHHCPWIWVAVEWINGLLFAMRYRRFDSEARRILAGFSKPLFVFSPVEDGDIDRLSRFLSVQPADSMAYFNPHTFDPATLKRLHRNRAFLMMKITRSADSRIVGYFFLRCFFIGRAFHGLIVDASARNNGLGSCMWMLAEHICRAARLRMFATVSAHNKASMASARRGTDVVVVESLANGYQLIECKPKRL